MESLWKCDGKLRVVYSFRIAPLCRLRIAAGESVYREVEVPKGKTLQDNYSEFRIFVDVLILSCAFLELLADAH